ncbi:protein of unknown function UPF0126 [Candidatus Koribacter versatilis Ellin345]|uniref:Glycine transporter domain-containing protein n=1 Tax=Koribacter versatilis (strain Ellin345) TaxID=204669 RepID=Q1IP72_KORVE|nr:TRIC cation channel family protein [Candidatus Koribacter versatilis]ABF41328.1 protein of unknown function UPF0126 [Candidatus Koribacter versatilis Ellin345]
MDRPIVPNLVLIDLIGAFLFGLEGALAGVVANLDLMGFLVLGFVTAFTGGIIRDLLIGAIPPSSLKDWRFPTAALAGAASVFFFFPIIHVIPLWSLAVLDAAALSLYAVAGTEKALLYNMPPVVAVLLGTVTGVGGGVVRDVLLAQVPTVLRADIYATAAIVGCSLMVLALKLKLKPALAATLGGIVCFALRSIAIWRHWNLPHFSLR